MKRGKTKSYVLDYLEVYQKQDKDFCLKIERIAKNTYNHLLRIYLNRFLAYEEDPLTIELKKEYSDFVKQMDDMSDSEKKNFKIENQETIDSFTERFNKQNDKHKWRDNGFSDSLLRKQQSDYWKQNNKVSPIGSGIVQKINDRAYQSVCKYVENYRAYVSAISKGRTDVKIPHINFVRKDDDFSIEGVTNEDSLYYREPYLIFNRFKNVLTRVYKRTNHSYYDLAKQDRIKYCRLISKTIKGKKRFFLQLIMEGTPPIYNKEYGDGDTIIADVNITNLILDENGKQKRIELAKGCDNPEDQLADIDRYINESRRINNPDNYNDDGTIKRGEKLIWIKSNNYLKAIAKRQDIYRKYQTRRRIAHNILANEILAKGSNVSVKCYSYKDQQKRAKGITINEKTNIPKSNARQGKNISNKAPAEFINILENKLGYIDKEIIDKTIKGKKQLSE